MGSYKVIFPNIYGFSGTYYVQGTDMINAFSKAMTKHKPGHRLSVDRLENLFAESIVGEVKSAKRSRTKVRAGRGLYKKKRKAGSKKILSKTDFAKLSAAGKKKISSLAKRR